MLTLLIAFLILITLLLRPSGTIFDLTGGVKSIRVRVPQRIAVHIGVSIYATQQADGIGLQIAPEAGVIAAMPVIG